MLLKQTIFWKFQADFWTWRDPYYTIVPFFLTQAFFWVSSKPETVIFLDLLPAASILKNSAWLNLNSGYCVVMFFLPVAQHPVQRLAHHCKGEGLSKGEYLVCLHWQAGCGGGQDEEERNKISWFVTMSGGTNEKPVNIWNILSRRYLSVVPDQLVGPRWQSLVFLDVDLCPSCWGWTH